MCPSRSSATKVGTPFFLHLTAGGTCAPHAGAGPCGASIEEKNRVSAHSPPARRPRAPAVLTTRTYLSPDRRRGISSADSPASIGFGGGSGADKGAPDCDAAPQALPLTCLLVRAFKGPQGAERSGANGGPCGCPRRAGGDGPGRSAAEEGQPSAARSAKRSAAQGAQQPAATRSGVATAGAVGRGRLTSMSAATSSPGPPPRRGREPRVRSWAERRRRDGRPEQGSPARDEPASAAEASRRDGGRGTLDERHSTAFARTSAARECDAGGDDAR